MPLTIQELVIQTKLKASNSSTSTQANPVSHQELRKFEKKLQYLCMEAMENLLQERQER